MEPAAVLAVYVKAQGVAATNAQLGTVQQSLVKTDAAGTAMARGMIKSGRKVEAAGKTMTRGVTLPLLAIAGASADLALHFDRDMSLIQDQAGASAKETAYFKRELLGLSGATKFGPDETAAALFRVRSAGFKGAEGMAALRQGMNLATVGNSNLEYTTKALTGASKSLDIHGSKAFKHLAAEMNATVGTGDMRMEELQDALSTGVIPQFVAAGLAFRDYGAALTVMTDRNVPAQVASTRLRTAITMLIPHSKKAEEALEGVGIKSEDLANVMRHKGLPAAIEFLAKHLDSLSKNKQNRIMIEAFGGAKSSATIELLVQNYEELFEKEKLIGEGVKKYNGEVQNMEHNPLVQLQKAWSAIQGDLIKVGDVLIPVIVPAFVAVADSVGGAVDAFAQLDPHAQHTVLIILGLVAAFGPLLRIFGFFMTKGGQLIIFLQKIGGMYEANTVAAEANTVANTELAASIQAVAGAQQELLIANKSGAVVGSVPVGSVASAAPAAATAEASAASTRGAALATAKSSAKSLAGGLASVLPGVIGMIGIGNILFSAVEGDMKGAAFKAGGAAAGAIAGGLIGGLPGAMIGLGIGSLLGGLINTDKELSPLQQQVKASAEAVAGAMDQQHQAAAGLREAQEHVKKVNHEVKGSAHQLARAEEHLKNVRKDRGGFKSLISAEDRVYRTFQRNARAIDRKRRALELLRFAEHHQRKSISEVVNKSAVAIAVEEKHLRHLKKVQQTEGSTPELQKKIGTALRRTSRYIQDYDEGIKAARAKNKKWAASLEEMSNVQHRFGRSGRALKREISDQKQKIGELRDAVGKGGGPYAKMELDRAEHKLHKLEGTMASVNRSIVKHMTIGEKMTLAAVMRMSKGVTGDSRLMKEAVELGMNKLGGNLNSFLSSLGVAKVSFGVKGEGGKHGKHGGGHQTGGMIVPGGGTGDKVPLTAMVEPGEVVHVLNSRASKDVRKLHALETLNHEVPRHPHLQEGGTLSGGATAAALAEASAIDAKHYPYLWGGGHSGFAGPYDCSGAVSAVLHAAGLLEKPMVSGDLASYGAPGPGPITIYANGVHAFMSIMGRFFGTSGSNPGGGAGFFPSSIGASEASGGDSGGAFQVRHPTGAGTIAALEQIAFKGPPGKLTEIGSSATSIANNAATEYAKKHMPGSWGGGDTNLEGGGGAVMAEIGSILSQHGANKIGAAGIIGNAVAESNLDPAAVGTGGGGLFGFTTGAVSLAALRAAAGRAGVPWDSAQFQTQFMLRHGGQGEIPKVNAAQSAAEAAVIFMNDWERPGIPRQDVREAGAKQALAAGWQKGGAFGLGFQKGGKAKVDESGAHPTGWPYKTSPSISAQEKNIVKGLKEGKHLPKYQAALKKLGRRIDGIGISQNRADRLGAMTKDVEKYAEFASNASTLTTEDEEGNIHWGVFKGHNESEWLNEQLGSLMGLRKEVIATHGTVEGVQLPRVNSLMKEAKERLVHVRKAIREAEQKKRELEKAIKEIEKAQNQTKHDLEQRQKELEHALDQAKNAKTPDKNKIASIQGELSGVKSGLSDNDKQAHNKVHDIKQQIDGIEEQQKGRHRVEGSLTGVIIPKLEEQQTGMHETLSGLYDNGGEIKGVPFMDLQTIQGVGSTTEDIPNPPELGSVGGEIFTVQNRLKEIQAEAERKNLPDSPQDEVAEELKAIAEEQALEWKKRYLVLESQTRTLQEMPSVQAIAAPPSVPYAGSFAMGGVAREKGRVMAWAGERGPEPIFPPEGARIIPSHEARRALERHSGGDINFEEVNFHESGDKVTGRANGQYFEKDVRSVNRKQVRKSMSRTPGGKGLKN